MGMEGWQSKQYIEGNMFVGEGGNLHLDGDGDEGAVGFWVVG